MTRFRQTRYSTFPLHMDAARLRALFVLLLIAVMIAGCGSPRKSGGSGPATRGGGYYMDDGPGDDIPPGIENIPDAVPRIEPHNPANFRPYKVMGQRFVPVSATTPLRQRGVASWYGKKFHGQKTANGETYDMYAMSAAHPTLPLPSYARVTHVKNGRSVIVRVNDRGPFLHGRVIDLSYAAAAKLGIIGRGSDVVEVEAITHADIRKGGYNVAAAPKAAAPAPAPVPRPPAPPAAPPAHATAPAAQPIAVATATPTPDALSVLSTATADASPNSQASSSATPTPTVTEEAADGIFLQFGAFASYISADRLANQLNGDIAQVEHRDVHVDSHSDLHRVRIGPYPSRTAAVNAAVRIQEATGMRPTLAQR